MDVSRIWWDLLGTVSTGFYVRTSAHSDSKYSSIPSAHNTHRFFLFRSSMDAPSSIANSRNVTHDGRVFFTAAASVNSIWTYSLATEHTSS